MLSLSELFHRFHAQAEQDATASPSDYRCVGSHSTPPLLPPLTTTTTTLCSFPREFVAVEQQRLAEVSPDVVDDLPVPSWASWLQWRESNLWMLGHSKVSRSRLDSAPT